MSEEERIRCADCGELRPISITAKVRNRFVCAICFIGYSLDTHKLKLH